MQPYEIIVVDSGSTDATLDVCSGYGCKIVHIRSEDFSFGRSLNVGCRATSGDLLVFISAHVYALDPGWLSSLVAPFKTEDIGLVYGRQTGDHRSQFSELQIMRKWFPSASVEDQRNPFCNNANCAIRRHWWERLPYDEDLTGLEDLDWAKRLLAAGGRIAYEASATVAHIHEESFARTRHRYQREAMAHSRIFHDQNVGSALCLVLFGSNVARDYAAALASRTLFRNLLAIPRFRAAQFMGIRSAFRSRGIVTGELRRRFYYPKGFESRRHASISRGRNR